MEPLKDNVTIEFWDNTLSVNFIQQGFYLAIGKGGKMEFRPTTICSLCGRNFEGLVMNGCGMSIVHPTDEAVMDNETGKKLAFREAVIDLYLQEWFWDEDFDDVLDGLWGSYQRARRNLPY